MVMLDPKLNFFGHAGRGTNCLENSIITMEGDESNAEDGVNIDITTLTRPRGDGERRGRG